MSGNRVYPRHTATGRISNKVTRHTATGRISNKVTLYS